MKDPIDELLGAAGDHWRSGLDPDPDIGGLLPDGTPRRRALPAVMVAAAAVLVIALAAVLITDRATRDDDASGLAASTGQLPHSTSGPVSAVTRLAKPVTCSQGRLRAPGVTSRPATRTQLQAFGAVAAVDCVHAQRRYPDGVWSIIETQVSGDHLDPLLTALDQSDTAGGSGVCALFLDPDPQLVLVNASGAFLRPRYPRDSCDHLQPAAKAATKQLKWRTIATTKLNLDIPDDPILRTCQQGWKNLIYLEAARRRLSTGGGAVVTGRATTCTYRSDGDPLAGAYVSGAQLQTQQASLLNTALSGAGQSGTCEPPPRFAVIHSAAGLAYVELGGCWRVLRPDGTFGRADPPAVQRILKL